jgi:hypothetical protein
MAGITQVIPTYVGGMSEQPDHIKSPGQVNNIVNGIPDVTYGLFKRPGSKRVGTNPLANVQSGGSWFHYYRDETEGSYIGQVAADGKIRVWDCDDGSEKTVWYGTDNTAYDASNSDHVAITSYLTASAGTEDIQALTINDTTFFNNRSKVVTTTGTTDTRAISTGKQENQAYIELRRTENGRQYSFNVSRPNQTETVSLKRATRIKIKSDTLDEGADTGSCPGIGTQVFTTSNGGSETLTLNNAVKFNNDHAYDQLTNSHHSSSEEYWLQTTSRHGGDLNSTINETNYFKLKNILTGETLISEQVTGTENNGEVTSIYDDVVTALKNANTAHVIPEYTANGSPAYTASGYTTKKYSELPFHIEHTPGSPIITLAYKLAGEVNFGKWQLTRCNAPTGTLNDNVHVNSESDPDWNQNGRDRPYQGLVESTDGSYDGVRSVLVSTGGTATDLIFRLTTLGQVSTVENKNDQFQCTYNRDIDLLHGGQGWSVGDTVTVTLDQAKGGGGSGGSDTTKAQYTVEVLEVETANFIADVKLARPTPTPFDSDTAITADTILGGMQGELTGINVNDADNLNPKPLNVQIIGNGLFFSCDNPFNIEIGELDLMRVIQKTTNDVTELPNQCKDGYIVRVANARMSDEDDYYLKFTADNGEGAGAWSECAAPGIVKSFNAATMPHVLQRQSDGDFLIKQFTWGDREVGDNTTNPIPSFADGSSKISKVLFFRNRIAVLSGENVVLCKPGTLASPDFWAETALTTSSVDPIDIACSSTFPSDLFDGIEINTGLLVFSSNQQFLLSSDDTVLNPDTAKLRSISTYNYNVNIPPISLGTTVGYIDNSGKYSRLNQLSNITREGEPNVAEVSKIVPSLLSKDIDIITNSRENQIILLGKTDTDTIYGLKYFNTGEKQVQTAWFKWKLNNKLLYHFIIDDVYYYLDEDHFLQKIFLVQSNTDLSINKDSINYQIHLDNYVTGVTGGVLDLNTNETILTDVDWISEVTTPNGSLVIMDGTGRYAKCTVNGDDIIIPGDWTTTPTSFENSINGYILGYLYDYQVDLPTLYVSTTKGEVTRTDVNASLTLHRLNFNFGKIGSYATTLTRLGKDPYTEIYESTDTNLYEASDVPYLEEEVRTIPVYERNKNVDISLKSTNPTPATLHSMSWEGDYTTKYYKRV